MYCEDQRVHILYQRTLPYIECEDLVKHYDQIAQWIFWRDNRDLYLVTGWKPEQDSVRMGVDHHAAAVVPIGHDGCIHTTIQPMCEFFRFENGQEVHL